MERRDDSEWTCENAYVDGKSGAKNGYFKTNPSPRDFSNWDSFHMLLDEAELYSSDTNCLYASNVTRFLNENEPLVDRTSVVFFIVLGTVLKAVFTRMVKYSFVRRENLHTLIQDFPSKNKPAPSYCGCDTPGLWAVLKEDTAKYVYNFEPADIGNYDQAQPSTIIAMRMVTVISKQTPHTIIRSQLGLEGEVTVFDYGTSRFDAAVLEVPGVLPSKKAWVNFCAALQRRTTGHGCGFQALLPWLPQEIRLTVLNWMCLPPFFDHCERLVVLGRHLLRLFRSCQIMRAEIFKENCHIIIPSTDRVRFATGCDQTMSARIVLVTYPNGEQVTEHKFLAEDFQRCGYYPDGTTINDSLGTWSCGHQPPDVPIDA